MGCCYIRFETQANRFGIGKTFEFDSSSGNLQKENNEDTNGKSANYIENEIQKYGFAPFDSR